MKRSFIPAINLIVLLFAAISSHAQDFTLQWAKSLPAASGPITTDSKGNVYLMGAFTGTVDFDPGAGTANLTATGTGTSYFAKYDAQGNYVFARQIGGFLQAITLDNNGNICITGTFSSISNPTIDVDPGAGTASFTNAGLVDFFVAKYDTSGNYLNAFAIGSVESEDVLAITTDVAGNIYVTGSFEKTVDFDPGAGTANLISASTHENIFVAKYSPAGAYIYAFKLANSSTSSSSDEGTTLATDAANNLYLGGRFRGTLDLDPGAGVVSSGLSNGLDGFIAKYDAAGKYLWGGSFDGNVYSLSLDASANVYVIGTTPDSMDADLGPGKAMLYSVNNFDIWMGKYTSAGAYVYAHAFESNTIATPELIVANNLGEAYIGGRYPDTIDFKPNNSAGSYISQGAFDAFAIKFDANGDYHSGMSIGSAGDERVRGMSVDNSGHLWVAGSFSGTIDFDPGTGTTNLTSTNASDAYFAKYGKDPVIGVPAITKNSQPIKVYGAQHAVITDFTALQQVDATIRVIDMMGRTVAEAKHNRNDMLRLQLPDAAPQVYSVIVLNAGVVTTKKLWVE